MNIRTLAAFLAAASAATGAVAQEVEVIRVRPDTIDARHVRDPSTATRMYREPGGWIADDVPIKKTESVHPKGMQKILAGAVPDPQDRENYLPRGELKSGMSEKDLLQVTPTRELKADKR